MRIFPYRWKRIAAEPFKLNPKHIYHINLFDDIIERIAHADRQFINLRRHKGRRADKYDLGAEFCHRPHTASGNS